MSIFALINGNTVSNIIVADSLQDALLLGNAVEITEDNKEGLSIGSTYDYELNKFTVKQLHVVEEVTDANL